MVADTQKEIDLVRSFVRPIVEITWGCICLVPDGESYVVLDLSPQGISTDEGARILQEAGLKAFCGEDGLRLSCNHGTPLQEILGALRLRAEPQILYAE